MNKALIEYLADGDFHSGEVLGRQLGLSRAAVWKHMEALAETGVPLERVKGKGYRIPGGMELLDANVLSGFADGRLSGVDINVVAETGSTNADLLSQARKGLPRPLALFAERQTGGRGRRGRQWMSPLGRNIYLSFACAFEQGASALEGLSLAVGVAVAGALEDHGLVGKVSLKWPNDVWVEGRKIGGILIELAGDLDSACVAVIGVGINVAPLSERMASSIDQPWTDMTSELGAPPSRNRLAADLLLTLNGCCQQFLPNGFAFFADRWQQYDALNGQMVRLLLAGTEVFGVCRGVSERGALILERGGQCHEYHGGEVSVRMAGLQ